MMSATALSQPKQIMLTDLKQWINKETAPIIEPLKNKGTNLFKETQERLNVTIESSEKIFENSDREMQKNNPKTYRFARNANKFARSVSETLKAVQVPEKVNYESLQTLGNDLEKS